MLLRWCFLPLLLVSHVLWADQPPPPLLISGADELPIKNSLYHYADTTGQVGIVQAIQLRNGGYFRPIGSPTIRQDFGYTTAWHWLYFELKADQPADLMLEIEYANLDRLELFEVRNGVTRSLGRAGDKRRFSQRPYTNNNYVFPIRLKAGDAARYFLLVDQRNAILSFFVRLWDRTAFGQTDRGEYLIWGGYIGIICIVMLINLVMLLATRDRIYLWYSLSLHFITMQIFSDSGLAFQYLWPNNPVVNDYAPVYLYVWAAMATQMTFMQYFIHQTRRNSRLYGWVNAFKGILVLAIGLAIAIPFFGVPGHERYLYNAVSLATSCFVPVMALLAMGSLYERVAMRPVRRSGKRKREPLVRYYGYALAVQLSGYMLAAVLNLCQAMGWPLPFDVETYAVIGVTVLLDTVFFSYGLAYRYQAANQRNQALELRLLGEQQQTQQRVIDSLEAERRRLAQDLHDDIGPTLATVKGYLSVLNRPDPTDALLRAQALIDRAADELRTISHQLMPKHFDQIGLAKAIEETTRKVGRPGLQIDFVTIGQPATLPTQTEMLLFSIATELIRHVQKRAQVTEATVQLIYHGDALNLTVEDNGPEPATGRPAETDLRHVRTKAGFLNADLLIDVNRQGTSVMLSMPTGQPVPA